MWLRIDKLAFCKQAVNFSEDGQVMVYFEVGYVALNCVTSKYAV